MVKLIEVVTEETVGILNLNAASTPSIGDRVKIPKGDYLVTACTYLMSKTGDLEAIELLVSKL